MKIHDVFRENSKNGPLKTQNCKNGPIKFEILRFFAVFCSFLHPLLVNYHVCKICYRTNRGLSRNVKTFDLG